MKKSELRKLIREEIQRLNEEDWAKDVDTEPGKMHKLLGVPEDETISSKYKSGEKLAKDLLKKVDRKTAAGMINFAANINKKETIFDDAQKWLSDNPEKEK